MYDELMRELEANNWNENESDFHIFNSKEELYCYIHRSKDGKWWREEYGRFDFEQCVFNFDVRQWVNEFDTRAWFTKATFNENASFQSITFKDVADFNGCTFEKTVSFKGAVFEGVANMCSFNGDVSFHKAKFKSDTYFWNHFVGYADFSYSEFSKTADFSNCCFEKDVKFHDSIFESDAFFNESEFIGKVNAWKITFLKDVTFKWTDFRDKANLSQLKVKKGFAEFYGSNFEKNAYFYDSEIKRLDLKKSVIDKGLFFLGASIKKNKRETARIIKNEFLKQNNKIEALKYHQKEMYAYLFELGLNIIKPKSLTGFFKSIGDIIILLTNLISNGFGLWWFLAILFLFSSTLIIYNWYLANLTSSTVIDFWKYYPEFILPTHKFGFIEGTLTNDCANIIDFSGRVVSSFAIYQVVQAFRKFGRL